MSTSRARHTSEVRAPGYRSTWQLQVALVLLQLSTQVVADPADAVQGSIRGQTSSYQVNTRLMCTPSAVAQATLGLELPADSAFTQPRRLLKHQLAFQLTSSSSFCSTPPYSFMQGSCVWVTAESVS